MRMIAIRSLDDVRTFLRDVLHFDEERIERELEGLGMALRINAMLGDVAKMLVQNPSSPTTRSAAADMLRCTAAILETPEHAEKHLKTLEKRIAALELMEQARGATDGKKGS